MNGLCQVDTSVTVADIFELFSSCFILLPFVCKSACVSVGCVILGFVWKFVVWCLRLTLWTVISLSCCHILFISWVSGVYFSVYEGTLNMYTILYELHYYICITYVLMWKLMSARSLEPLLLPSLFSNRQPSRIYLREPNTWKSQIDKSGL